MGTAVLLSCVGVLAVLFCSAGSEETKVDYNIDVLALADYSLYSKFLTATGTNDPSAAELKVKEYIAYLFEGINRRYAAITTLSFNIRIHLTSVLVETTTADSPWTEKVKNVTAGAGSSGWVQADAVLQELEKYVKDNNTTIPAHDHLMLFTGYDLVGRDASTSGFAGVKTVCTTNGLSVSVIEDQGAAVTEATAAHELGHSLGAEHDGTNNTCKASDLYIMSPGGAPPSIFVPNLDNTWRFSNCTIKYFNDNMQALKNRGLESTCLKKKLPQTIPAVPAYFPLHPDEQCRQTYGPSSYLCREYVPEPSDICQMMRCFNPAVGNRSCSLLPAATGTCCGSGKWCQHGVCLTEPTGGKCSNSKDMCPFGDQTSPVVQENGQISCATLAPQHCYELEIRLKCCEKCQQVHINKPGCNYGDRVTNCDSRFCSSLSQTAPKEYDMNCCGTCNATKPIDPNCSNQAGLISVVLKNSSGQITQTIEGVTCHELLLEPKNKRLCCSGSIQQTCCYSCLQRRSTSESCPYGDCAASGCERLLQQPMNCTDQQKSVCCKTCGDLEEALTRTTTTPRTSTNTRSSGSGSGSESGGGSGGSESGSSGSEGGNSGSEGGNSGSEGGNSGSEGGNSGSEGGSSGSEGGNSGSEGGNSGSEGGNSGSEGGNSGSEGGNSGSEGGNSGSEGGNSGSEGGSSESGCGSPGQPTCGACLLSANLSLVVALSSLISCLRLGTASL